MSVDQATDHHRVVDDQHPDRVGAGHAATSPSSASFSAMTSSVNGLITYSWAPAASARDDLRLLALGGHHHQRDVAHVGRARTAWMNVSPSITGMFQSTRMTSGFVPASSSAEGLLTVPGLGDVEAEAAQQTG
jgi:hypothetical protein